MFLLPHRIPNFCMLMRYIPPMTCGIAVYISAWFRQHYWKPKSGIGCADAIQKETSQTIIPVPRRQWG
jgi:hypothetical protein